MTVSPDQPLGLAEVQRWVQHAILRPEGPPDAVERVVTGSSRLSARDRLAVYWRGYRLRLLEAMRGLYPALCHLLGEPLFDRFVLDYLDTYPPRSYSLFRLGDRFAQHLAATRPDADGLSSRESWPDLLIDLAAFERTFTDVLDGPGPEKDPIPGSVDVPRYAGDSWPDLRLAPATGLRLVAARFVVHEFAVAVHRGESPPLPAHRSTYLAVRRCGYQVRITELAPSAHHALRALVAGEPLSSVMRSVAPAVGTSWLADWLGSGLLTTPRPIAPSPTVLNTSTERTMS